MAADGGASVSLDRMCAIVVNLERDKVTVEAGATVSSIHIALERVGRALSHTTALTTTALTTETIGGCVAAGTHSIGRGYGLLASLVVSGTLVLPDGSVKTGTVADDPLIRASLVGLGLLGVWHSITLRTVPLFHLKKEIKMIASADTFYDTRVSEELLSGADSVQWFVYPATNSAKIVTRHAATPEDTASLPGSWNGEGTAASTHTVSCDVGYRAVAYPCGTFDGRPEGPWRQTESEFFLPAATAIDVAKAFIDGSSEEDRACFFVFGRYVAAGDHLLGPNQVDSVALTCVVPHIEEKPDDPRFKALQDPFEAACVRAGGRPH